ncbi:MAG: hypothetical protein ACXVRZ_05980 [Gaiellaceae bacterium]
MRGLEPQTTSAVRQARRLLRDIVLEGLALTPPLASLRDGERGMWLILGRLRPSCLERAIVLQAWLAARGRAHDVVRGRHPQGGPGFQRTRRIDAEEPSQRDKSREIARFTPVRY